jgi:hypothetical protein
MAHGWSRDPKIKAFSSGTPLMHRLKWFYTVIKIQVRGLAACVHSNAGIRFDSSLPLLVISIDLSPTGGVLASGSGDWSVRVCTYITLGPAYSRSSRVATLSRVLHDDKSVVMGDESASRCFQTICTAVSVPGHIQVVHLEVLFHPECVNCCTLP